MRANHGFLSDVSLTHDSAAVIPIMAMGFCPLFNMQNTFSVFEATFTIKAQAAPKDLKGYTLSPRL
jgi:hypothetical protein